MKSVGGLITRDQALKKIRGAVRGGQKVLTHAEIMDVILDEIGSKDLVLEAIEEAESEGAPPREYVTTGVRTTRRRVLRRPIRMR